MARQAGFFKMEVPHYGECSFRKEGVVFSGSTRVQRWRVLSMFNAFLVSVDVPLRTTQAGVYQKAVEAIKAKELSEEIDSCSLP